MKWIILQYKYEGDAWTEYDRTAVAAWAEVQYTRMTQEHPKAKHRRLP